MRGFFSFCLSFCADFWPGLMKRAGKIKIRQSKTCVKGIIFIIQVEGQGIFCQFRERDFRLDQQKNVKNNKKREESFNGKREISEK